MGCGCAARMRKYILPRLGYKLIEDFWVNVRMKQRSLQRIPDTDITKYHRKLVAVLARSKAVDLVQEVIPGLFKFRKS